MRFVDFFYFNTPYCLFQFLFYGNSLKISTKSVTKDTRCRADEIIDEVKYRVFSGYNKRSIINECNSLYNEIRDMKTGNYDTVLTIINNNMI